MVKLARELTADTSREADEKLDRLTKQVKAYTHQFNNNEAAMDELMGAIKRFEGSLKKLLYWD